MKSTFTEKSDNKVVSVKDFIPGHFYKLVAVGYLKADKVYIDSIWLSMQYDTYAIKIHDKKMGICDGWKYITKDTKDLDELKFIEVQHGEITISW